MAYKIGYDGGADVLTVILREKGELSYAKEVGDFIVHFDEDGKSLFMEMLRASKIVPLMVEGLAKKKLKLLNFH